MRFFLCIIALTWVAPAAAAPTIQVGKSAKVIGPTIELGEIAQLRGFTKARKAEVAAITVGKSPVVGLGQYMPRAYLEGRIRDGGVNQSTRLILPLRVELSRKEKLIKGEEVEARIRAALNEAMPHAAEDIALIRVPHIADIKAPDGADVSVRLDPMDDFTDVVVVDVLISDEGERVRSRRVSVLVDLFVETYGVSQNVRRGYRLTTTDLVVLRIPRSRVPKDAIARPEFVEGAMVRRDIKPGEPIRDAFLQVPPMVERGQRVRMIARRGGVSITSIGEALNNGSRGAMIRVRNVQSRKIVGGKIISPGVVEMEF